MPTSLKRRQLLQGIGLGVLATRGYTVTKNAPVHFTHGVASGDPLSDRVILWTRLIPEASLEAVSVVWQIAHDQGFTEVVASGETETQAERDYVVKVDATGLTPATAYFYRFIAMGVNSEVGQTRTLPTGSVASFRMGVASCSNYPQGFFNAYRHMADTDLNLVLHLGDYIYEYPEGEYANDYALDVLGRQVEPRHEILALEDYRMRYGLYRSDPDLQAVHRRHPFICVWDDHELANDTWSGGAENHNEEDGDFAQRIHAARQAYHEWMPIRTSPEGDQGPIYRQFALGDLADLIMLDTRLEGRDKGLEYSKDMTFGTAASSGGVPELDIEAFKSQHLYDPKRALLGEKQEAWLERSVARSTERGAVWQVLGQQVLISNLGIPRIAESVIAEADMSEEDRQVMMFYQQLATQDMPMNLDAWDGYPVARDRVTDMLAQHKANTVVLAGDTHNAWAFNLSAKTGEAIGVEIGTPGINSPGLESYSPLPVDELGPALQAVSPELISLDVSRRGWSEVTLTHDAVTSCWHFVSTVLDRRFEVQSSSALVCPAGQREFNVPSGPADPTV